MIIDKLDNWHLYKGIGQNIQRGFQFLKSNDLLAMAPGSYNIDRENIYLKITQYKSGSLNETLWEVHKNYIDLRYIIKGYEALGYPDVGTLKLEKTYNPQNDASFYSGQGDIITLHEGYFVLLFPGEAHKNYFNKQNQSKEEKYVKKAVVKILF